MPPLNESIISRKQLSGKAYWRSLNEYAETPEFAELMAREFPAVASEALSASTRRSFLKVMGASLALAGLAFTGCRWPKEKLAPYADRPEGFADGQPVEYATAMELAGVAVGLLATSFDGRPIKIEGNPGHPGSLGGASAQHQASVLELYDPDRSKLPVQRQEGQTIRKTWDDFAAFATEHFAKLRSAQGQGLAVLCEQTSSPSMLYLRGQMERLMPAARFYEYEALSRDNGRRGTAAVFSQPHRALPVYDQAEVIVSLADDFLLNHPNAVRFARDFAAGRRAETGRMSRLYVVESGYSLTGANADHRIAVRPGEVATVACAVAAELALNLGLPLPVTIQGQAPTLAGFRISPQATPLINTLARDLFDHRGCSIVTVGPGQPPEIHALACLLNEALGNVGRTLSYIAEEDSSRPSHLQAITELCSRLEQGDVQTLLILGGNPAFDAPADLGFADKLAKVPTSIHLGPYDDETSQLCTWHVPRAHFLEAWGDACAYDGTVSVVQPLIDPLYGGKSAIEVLALVTGDSLTSGYDIVRRTLGTLMNAPDFEAAWRKTLNDGMLEGSAWLALSPQGDYSRLPGQLGPHAAPQGLEVFDLLLQQDASVYDGRFANNGWLQEMPDPMTKLTWDNAVQISVADATEHGLAHGDVVELSSEGQSIAAPVYVMPGQARGTLALSLGYGRRRAGRVGNKVGVNAYALRRTANWDVLRGVTLKKTGRQYKLAEVQDHWAIDRVGLEERGKRVGELVREATLDFFKQTPDFARRMQYLPPAVPLWTRQEHEGHRWAMAIDLNSCNGCGACIVACVAENNIPVVGKERVAEGREMHWLRVDRYFSGEPEEAKVVQQPLTCHHCEDAPCEQVCPFAATMHSSEGLNEMIYNRCVGTRYCSNNCPYKVRRFNFFNYHRHLSETEKMQFNPDVTVRSRGVMEKCSFCVQRIQEVKITAKNERRPISDGEITPACAQTCPAQAIYFGDLNDPESKVRKLHEEARAYAILEELNVKPRTKYLARLRNPATGTPEYDRRPELVVPEGGAADGSAGGQQ
jgi:molybdopterin-containing oxidoreductase family iron-sulfur binding subunit